MFKPLLPPVRNLNASWKGWNFGLCTPAFFRKSSLFSFCLLCFTAGPKKRQKLRGILIKVSSCPKNTLPTAANSSYNQCQVWCLKLSLVFLAGYAKSFDLTFEKQKKINAKQKFWLRRNCQFQCLFGAQIIA